MKKKIEIESFMTDDLGLNGNNLVLYAVLWMESKQGTRKVNNDYQRYSRYMNVMVPTYYNVLKRLQDAGLVVEQVDKKLAVYRQAA